MAYCTQRQVFAKGLPDSIRWLCLLFFALNVQTSEAQTSATAITATPASMTTQVATSVTLTGSASGDLYKLSNTDAADCTGVTPDTAISSANEVVSFNIIFTGTYQLCYRASGETDSVAQTNAVLTVVAATSPTEITISPSSISAGHATSVTFTGSANNDYYKLSPFATGCTGVTPDTQITSANSVEALTVSSTGTYRICYRAAGGSDVESQTNGILTVVAATPASAITVSPTSISAGSEISMTFTGSANGAHYKIIEPASAGCGVFTPDTQFTFANQIVPLTITTAAGTYNLCYQAPGGSDSVQQTNGVFTVVAATPATKITMSVTGFSAGLATSSTFTGSVSGDLYKLSAVGASDCTGVVPDTPITSVDEVVTFTLTTLGSYQLCYRNAGGTDSVPQTNSAFVVVAATSASAITLSPASISANQAVSLTLTGSAVNDYYSITGAGAADCTGTTPSTQITSVNQVRSLTMPNPGTYQLCYRAAGGSDSVLQTNGVLTVVAATPITKISISPSSIPEGTPTSVTFTGSVTNDLYKLSSVGAADCTGVIPDTSITSTNEAVTLTMLTGPGVHKLCYRNAGGTDVSLQTLSDLTVVAATWPTRVTTNPSSISAGTATIIALTGAANQSYYKLSAAGAADCTGVTPDTLVISPSETVTITVPAPGTYLLCYRDVGMSDSVAQDNGVLTVIPATPASVITISPTTMSCRTDTSVTLTGSANGDLYAFSVVNAADCTGVIPNLPLTTANEVVTFRQREIGTYQLCYRKSGGSDSVPQTNGVVTTIARTSATAVTLSPRIIFEQSAYSITFFGSASGDLYSFSAPNAADCTGVIPSTQITSNNEVVTLTITTGAGTYLLCYRDAGGSDSVSQTTGSLTVYGVTSPLQIHEIAPASISAGFDTTVQLRGSRVGDSYTLSAAGAADCSGATPDKVLNDASAFVIITVPTAGTYQLCYQGAGLIDSVAQTSSVLTVVAATSATAVTASPTSIPEGTPTSVTLTGVAVNGLYSLSAPGALNCSAVVPSTSITSANEVVTLTVYTGPGTYQLCYRDPGGSDSQEQTNSVLTLTPATWPIAITTSPSSMSATVATSVTFTGSANGDLYKLSAAGASDCTGVIPDTALTSVDEVVVLTVPAPGTYKLCYRRAGRTDSVSQDNGVITVVAPTSPTAITMSVTSILEGTPTSVTFTGSASNGFYSLSAQGAADCSGVIPSIQLTSANEAVTLTVLTGPGTYKLCYRAPGGSDSVAQTISDLTVQQATWAIKIGAVPTGLSAGVTTTIYFNGSTPGDLYKLSAVGAADCTGVVPDTSITDNDEYIDFTLSVIGTYRLCYRTLGMTDSASQINSVLTVVAATSPTAITISPATISSGVVTSVVFTGSNTGDYYKLSAPGAADCSGVVPDTRIASGNAAVQIYAPFPGMVKLCYRAAGGSDSVSQTNGVFTVIPGAGVGGDPVSWYGNLRTEFNLPIGTHTVLLQMPDLVVLAWPFEGKGEDQWIERVLVASNTGELIVEVQVRRDLMDFDRTKQERNAFETLDVVVGPSAFPSRLVHIPNYDEQIDHPEGFITKFARIGAWTPRGAACLQSKYWPCRENLHVVGGYGMVSVESSSAIEYYGNTEEAMKHIHLDIDIQDMVRPETFGGVLPEIWGLRPMSNSTRAMIKSQTVVDSHLDAGSASVKSNASEDLSNRTSGADGSCDDSAHVETDGVRLSPRVAKPSTLHTTGLQMY